MPLRDLVVVDSAETLHHALRTLDHLDVVGVDVERADWDRYFRAAALVQVGGDGVVAVVDPLAFREFDPLQRFLVERTVVLHAMENDLVPLAALGLVPELIHDTALAAALLGLPTGLEGLLRDLIGVELAGDKQAMQRADWEARPLTAEMLTYAAGDVADLPALWSELASRLEETGRMGWYREELAAALALPPVEERRDWTRTKGAGRLDPAGRARLRALWDARERLARSTDTAPARIAADRVLIDFAVTPPANVGDLVRRGLRRAAARDYGDALLAAIAAGDAAGPDVRRRNGRVPTDLDRTREDRLRALRSARARELGIEPGVLCPSRTIMGALLCDPASPEEFREALGLRDWQWAQVGGAFCEVLALDAGGGRTAMTVLDTTAVGAALEKLPGWEGSPQQLTKTFTFADFAEALRFTNRIGALAEERNHHPDITIRWNKVTVELSTHSAGGVTENDIGLAEAIEATSAS